MPTYDYHCHSCGHHCEVLQKISEEPLKDCPECQESTLQRGPGGGLGLIFKGSGFYITDYNKSSDTNDTPTTENTKKEDSSAQQVTTEA